MPDGQGPVDIVGLAKTLAELGMVAVEGIKAVKGWGKGKEVEKLIKDIGKMQQRIRVLVGSLCTISEKAERSIEEYVAMGNDEKTTELFNGTISIYEYTYPILPDFAAKEAMLHAQRFERRVTSLVQSQALKESYDDLKSTFKIRRKKNK